MVIEDSREYKAAQELERALNDYDESYGTDLRNQASHELCKKIIESGALDEAYLPFI